MVTRLSVTDLVDKAIEEAPKFVKTSESPEAPSIEGNKYMMLAEELDKIGSKLESKQDEGLQEFKDQQSEKTAAFMEIVETYLELEK